MQYLKLSNYKNGFEIIWNIYIYFKYVMISYESLSLILRTVDIIGFRALDIRKGNGKKPFRKHLEINEFSRK